MSCNSLHEMRTRSYEKEGKPICFPLLQLEDQLMVVSIGLFPESPLRKPVKRSLEDGRTPGTIRIPSPPLCNQHEARRRNLFPQPNSCIEKGFCIFQWRKPINNGLCSSHPKPSANDCQIYGPGKMTLLLAAVNFPFAKGKKNICNPPVPRLQTEMNYSRDEDIEISQWTLTKHLPSLPQHPYFEHRHLVPDKGQKPSPFTAQSAADYSTGVKRTVLSLFFATKNFTGSVTH